MTTWGPKKGARTPERLLYNRELCLLHGYPGSSILDHSTWQPNSGCGVVWDPPHFDEPRYSAGKSGVTILPLSLEASLNKPKTWLPCGVDMFTFHVLRTCAHAWLSNSFCVILLTSVNRFAAGFGDRFSGVYAPRRGLGSE